MYREPDAKPRCPLCASESLVDTKYDPSEGMSYLHFEVKDPEPSFFGNNFVERMPIERGRVCLDCGNVTLALAASTLARLKANLSRLRPIP